MGADAGDTYQVDVEFPLGSHKYCLIVDTEGLTLLNEEILSKEERDGFSCMQRIIELAMDTCEKFMYVQINSCSLEI